MHSILHRLLTAGAVFAAALALAAIAPANANAAAPCALDRFETDDYTTLATTAAPISTGRTVSRAICQDHNEPAGGPPRIDEDYFVFTARGGTAYAVDVPSAGSALTTDFNVGGLYRIDNGSVTPLMADSRRDFRGFRTTVLPPGRYAFVAYSSANQVYPGNIMDTASIAGAAGRYSVRLQESPAAPVVTSLTLASATVNGGKNTTATYTLSAPVPEGGVFLFTDSTSRLVANPEPVAPPIGSTRGTVTINTGRVGSDQRIVISLYASTGTRQSATLTVRR